MTTQLNKLQNEINLIEVPEIKELVINTLNSCPSCFWTIPASVSGKYHNEEDKKEGGLIHHTKAVVKTAMHFCTVFDLNGCNKDIIVAACILHDCVKKYDYEKYTSHEHPLRAGKLFESEYLKKYTPGEDLELDDACHRIKSCIESHMGRWNKSNYSKTTLPIPETKEQQIVHMADYIASRGDISITIEDAQNN